MDKVKLVHQLFIGKVADIIGSEKTRKLLKEAKEAFAIPNVMRCFPTIKQRNEQVDKQIGLNKHFNSNEQNYRQGFMAGYNWTKREVKKNNA